MLKIAKEDPHKLFIAVDLQQALPTPKLSVGQAFYKRKLWTYNWGIHACGNDLGCMYFWSEDVASRGSDDIGSCLLQFLSAPDLPRDLYVIADILSWQNKNWKIIHMWHNLVADKFDNLFHIFPIS